LIHPDEIQTKGNDHVNWEALGAIGEIVGAFAVVLTLVYLAVQTRQNTKAVQHAYSRGVVEDANEWRFRIIESAEIAELFRSGLRDPQTLSDNDLYRFRMLMDSLVFHWQHGFHANQWVPVLNITRVLGTPGGTWYWTRAKDVMEADFIAYVEGLLAGA
jgi:hypothetical protein